MSIIIKKYEEKYLEETIAIWNEVIEEGVAFPQEDFLGTTDGAKFLLEQDYTAVAVKEDTDEVLGMYILHPNNVGRCGHIANASFAIASKSRGLHIGEKLVSDCLTQAKNLGFTLMQFNAVVENNIHARHLYERLGFQEVGMIPRGFRMKDGHYENIYVYYHEL